MNSDQGRRPAYRIVTRRLVLRCWEPSDAPALNAALTVSWSHLAPWMPFAQGEPPPLEDTLALTRRWRAQFDLDQDYVYGIFDADEQIIAPLRDILISKYKFVPEIRHLAIFGYCLQCPGENNANP